MQTNSKISVAQTSKRHTENRITLIAIGGKLDIILTTSVFPDVDMSTRWLRWSEVAWRQRGVGAEVLRLCEKLAQIDDEPVVKTSGRWDGGLAEQPNFRGRLESALAEAAVYFGGQIVIAQRREGRWDDFLGQRTESLRSATGVLNEILDRESAVFAADTLGLPAPVLGVPIRLPTQQVLLIYGPRVTEEHLASVWPVARTLAVVLRHREQSDVLQTRLDRLRMVSEAARTFSTVKETQPLLELIAREATRILDCDRASIFIWDRDQRQIVACPALGVPGGKLWLPDNKGIVGEVIQTGVTIQVDNAYSDPRFDQSVDHKSGYKTRNLLCVPLLLGDGQRIGAFELINKNHGDFTTEDAESLLAIGVQAAVAVGNSMERDQLVRSNQQLTERVTGNSSIVGESPAIAMLRGTIERLAATDLPVLILGESGTGKEVAASALHFRGPRAKHPFIAVNCAALTETLLESELFGHEKGAFTDAHATHVGKFELAEGGTLFLDEIGDMTLGGQAKLLRVLEQKVITRVGGTQSIPINVRVLAATNAHLSELVRQKRFRQDLYYRLSVVTVDIPPLRDRSEDVLPLADFFLDRFCKQANRKRLIISPDARRRLQTHGWPGNVRELRNLMERVAFLTTGERVEVSDLAFILSPQKDNFTGLTEGQGLAGATDHFQMEYIRLAIKRVQNNMTEAARTLGLHRSNLYRKMRQLGMHVDESEDGSNSANL